MADVTIAQLPTLAVEPTDVVEIQKTGGGESGKYTVQELANLAPTGVAWGQITGNLSNQTDLQAALDLKADADAYLPLTGGDLDGTLSAIDIIGVRSGTYPLFFTKSSNSGNAATGELRMSDLDGVQIAQIGVLSNSHNDLYIRANLGELVFQPEGNITAGRWSAAGLDVLGTLDVGGAFTSPGIDDNATSTAVTIDSSQRLVGGSTTATNTAKLNASYGPMSSAEQSTLVGGNLFHDGANYVKTATALSGAGIEFVQTNSTGAYGQILFLQIDDTNAASGTIREALRIDGSQNLLVNTTTPSSFAVMTIKSRAQFGAAIAVQNDGTAGGWARLDLENTQAVSSALLYQDSAGTLTIRNDSNSIITMLTNATEALRIDSSQSVLFGTTSNPSASVPGVGYDANLNRMRSSTELTTSVQHYQFFNPNGTVGSITTSGSATAYNTSSDPRLKTSGKPVDGVEALSIIRNVVESEALYKFQWVNEFEEQGAEAQWIWGFDAHKIYDITNGLMGAPGDGPRDAELGSVYQEEITEEQPVLDDEGEPVLDDDGNPVMRTVIVQPEKRVTPWGVDQSKPVPILAAALYEVARQVEELKATIH